MKKLYTAPVLTTVTVHVEHGYAMSLRIDTPDVGGGGDMTESRNTSSGWGKDNDDAFWSDNTYSTGSGS